MFRNEAKNWRSNRDDAWPTLVNRNLSRYVAQSQNLESRGKVFPCRPSMSRIPSKAPLHRFQCNGGGPVFTPWCQKCVAMRRNRRGREARDYPSGEIGELGQVQRRAPDLTPLFLFGAM